MDLTPFDNWELSINNVRQPLRPTHKEELYKLYNNIPYDSYWLNVENDSIYFLDHRTSTKMYVVEKNTYGIHGNVYDGIVLYTGTDDAPYMVVKLFDIDEDYFFGLALDYVTEHNLGWNIVRPYSWAFHNLGIHVTIDSDVRVLNHNVRVKLGKMVHFSSSKSHWVAIEVEIDGISCPGQCHISIGQERFDR